MWACNFHSKVFATGAGVSVPGEGVGSGSEEVHAVINRELTSIRHVTIIPINTKKRLFISFLLI
jgi:hypothetical protein